MQPIEVAVTVRGTTYKVKRVLCVADACGLLIGAWVNFCPYCGTKQRDWL